MNILKWNLDDILSVEKFDEFFWEIQNDIGYYPQLIKKLDPRMEEELFKEIIDFDENLSEKISRLSYLPHLMETTNQKDQKAQILKSKADQIIVSYEEVSRKLFHWLKGKKVNELEILDNKNAERLFESIPDLEFQLKHNREASKYALNESEENIISNKNISGIFAVKDLRRQISTGFRYKLKIKNQKTRIIKTQAELTNLAHSSKPEERKAAYLSLFKEYEKNLDKFFIIYQAVVKDWNYEAKLRGYESAISIRNFNNHISNEVIEMLLKTCSENKYVFQKYFRYKAKEMGVEKLNRFDIYAPFKARTYKHIEFNKAKELVLETFKEFSPSFYNQAKKIFDDKHIDSHPNPEKRSGAFCATISPKITPYIMMNFTGEKNDLYTLAHELGHGIHSLLANNHYYSSQQATLPLAETASTLSELILFEKTYKNEHDSKVKKTMLIDQIASSYASILRQNYFVLFEIEAHKLINSGCNSSQLSELWLNTLKEQFGDSVEVDRVFKNEWAYIPHIFDTPFYCYSYNFGELLSYALYSRYKKEGLSFVSKIETILKSGGSEDPEKILMNAGINIKDKNFWQSSFEIINEWQSTLEKL